MKNDKLYNLEKLEARNNKEFSGRMIKLFMPRQKNLWVVFGSGSDPSV